MASHWGSSWGSHWGNSWGTVGGVQTSTVGGGLSRKRWRELEDLWAAKNKANEKASGLTGDRQKAVQRAVFAVQTVLDAATAAADAAIKQEQINRLARAVAAAASAGKLAESIRAADRAANLAQAILRKMAEDEEEEEAIALLMMM